MPCRQTNNNNTTTTASGPNHRTADQPKSVLRTTSTTTEPASGQTTDPRLAANEFEAAIGLAQLQMGIDKHEPRERELAQLAAENPIGHYYAQTPAERAPGVLGAAAVLFGMGGGDAAQPSALLTLLRLQRKRAEGVKRAGMARLVGVWRAVKEKREGGNGVKAVPAEGPEREGRKKGPPAAEAGGEEAPKKKSVRFGGEA